MNDQQTLPGRFEYQVDLHPHRVAIRAAGEELTYEALEGQANRFARALIARLGDRPEPIVLLVAQDISLAVAILGVLKAGKYYVPLDPLMPAPRIAELLEDLDPRLLVAAPQWLSLAREIAPSSLPVMNLEDVLTGPCAYNRPDRTVTPDSTAYVYFTSGSTGRPKGVVDTHRNVLHNIWRYTKTLHFTANDRFTLLQTPEFSGAVSSLFGALLNGGCVFPFNLRDSGLLRLFQTLRDERITVYHSVPSIFRLIAPMGESFPDLRLIRLEGDRTSPRDVELFRQHFPDSCVLVNGLGTTECGIVRQHFMGKRSIEPTIAGNVPVGHAVPDMEVVVVDAEGNPVPCGSVGEIAVRSEFLAVGYWKRPDLTERAFQADAQRPQLRTYRTGDLGRLLPGGSLLHLGRCDAQVKVLGMWVNLAELEITLVEASGAQEAVILAKVDGGDENTLTAYLVPGESGKPSVTELRTCLKALVPDHMVPSRFIFIDRMPTTPTGKIDRRALTAASHANGVTPGRDQ